MPINTEHSEREDTKRQVSKGKSFSGEVNKRFRYPPIPIIGGGREHEYRGKVVYRGLQPRTSDAYFRMLREVGWGEPR